MDITPILNRELLVAVRKRQVWAARVSAGGMILAFGLATFGARYYWDLGKVPRHDMMARAAHQAFLWMLPAHLGLIFAVFAARAALAIADENDRRTLDFLLATNLSNAEIVLGKVVVCLSLLAADFAVGLPIMLLLHSLGGIDLRSMLLAYGGLLTTGFFMIALAMWVSSRAPNARFAVSAAISWWVGWLIVPFVAARGFPRFRLPGPLVSANAWVLASSPVSIALKIFAGIGPSSQLTEAVAWMSGLQVAGGALLLSWTIAHLRSAYRKNTSGDTHSVTGRLTRPNWRWRAKPPVGDDPILWREMNLAHGGLLDAILMFLTYLLLLSVIIYFTYFFARPALTEVWQHGYSSGITSAERPEWNLVIRLLTKDYGVNPPADIARTDLNLYLRYITLPFIFVITLFAAGAAGEGIVSERARTTWDSLIATPLSAREILRSKTLAALWRVRLILATLLGLWSIGLIAGAIHPLGFAISLLLLFGWTWLMLAFGICVSVSAKDMSAAINPTMGLVLVLTGSGTLPFLLPSPLSSVLLGAGSPMFAAFLSLASYRDIRNAWHYPAYPFLQWIQVSTGEGPLRVAATCLIGVIVPTIAGFYFWRYSVNQFDRLIGRPYKPPIVQADHFRIENV